MKLNAQSRMMTRQEDAGVIKYETNKKYEVRGMQS